MKVSRDFFMYRSGVYKCSNLASGSRTGYHSVRIVGWGEEYQNGRIVRYWVRSNVFARRKQSIHLYIISHRNLSNFFFFLTVFQYDFNSTAQRSESDCFSRYNVHVSFVEKQTFFFFLNFSREIKIVFPRRFNLIPYVKTSCNSIRTHSIST